MYYILLCFALGLGVWLRFEFHLPEIFLSYEGLRDYHDKQVLPDKECNIPGHI
jgi:hypothetical protein